MPIYSHRGYNFSWVVYSSDSLHGDQAPGPSDVPGDHVRQGPCGALSPQDEPGADLPGRAGASGIHFPEHVPGHIAKALRRIHQNLGHPSNQDLARHLKLSGAGDIAVKAAHSLRCETCARHTGPGTRRPAKMVRALDFNQEVCLDTLNLFDSEHKKIETLSILDMATGTTS